MCAGNLPFLKKHTTIEIRRREGITWRIDVYDVGDAMLLCIVGERRWFSCSKIVLERRIVILVWIPKGKLKIEIQSLEDIILHRWWFCGVRFCVVRNGKFEICCVEVVLDGRIWMFVMFSNEKLTNEIQCLEGIFAWCLWCCFVRNWNVWFLLVPIFSESSLFILGWFFNERLPLTSGFWGHHLTDVNDIGVCDLVLLAIQIVWILCSNLVSEAGFDSRLILGDCLTHRCWWCWDVIWEVGDERRFAQMRHQSGMEDTISVAGSSLLLHLWCDSVVQGPRSIVHRIYHPWPALRQHQCTRQNWQSSNYVSTPNQSQWCSWFWFVQPGAATSSTGYIHAWSHPQGGKLRRTSATFEAYFGVNRGHLLALAVADHGAVIRWSKGTAGGTFKLCGVRVS